MDPVRQYAELVRLVRDEVLLGSIAATLEWDEETCMPEAGGENRARQQGLLAGLVHDRAIDPRRRELLGELEAADLPPDAALNVRDLISTFERDRRVPRGLVSELAEATALAPQAWAEARMTGDYASFAPALERVITLKRAEAQCLMVDGGVGNPYDALLDDHEEGLTWAELATIFDQLKRGLGPLVDRARGAASPPATALAGDFPIDLQRRLGEWLAGAVGFDLAAGRLDPAIHPFAIGLGPGDCRLAGRWDERDLLPGLSSVLHEVGHGLYEQGLDQAEWGLPCGTQVSDAIDESQARFYQHVLGKSPGFWRFLWPALVERFPLLGAHDRDALIRGLHRIAPGCSRVAADEVTYHLHILIRVELERALIDGALGAGDLPDAWDAAYASLLGVTPPSVLEGCLQDGHWAEGLFGYFPCYTLGDIYAATLLGGATTSLGDLEAQWRAGEFRPIREWLRTNIHAPGCRRSARDLVASAAGQPPSAAILIAHLTAGAALAYGVASPHA